MWKVSAVSKQRCEQCRLSENKHVNSVSCQQNCQKTKTWTVSAASKQRCEQCQLSANKDVNIISCQQTKMWRMSPLWVFLNNVSCQQTKTWAVSAASKDLNSVSCQQAKTWIVSAASKQRREQCQCGLEIPEQGGRYSSPLPSPSHTDSTNKDMNSLRLSKYLGEVLDVQIYRSPPPPPPPPPPTHTHTSHTLPTKTWL